MYEHVCKMKLMDDKGNAWYYSDKWLARDRPIKRHKGIYQCWYVFTNKFHVFTFKVPDLCSKCSSKCTFHNWQRVFPTGIPLPITTRHSLTDYINLIKLLYYTAQLTTSKGEKNPTTKHQTFAQATNNHKSHSADHTASNLTTTYINVTLGNWFKAPAGPVNGVCMWTAHNVTNLSNISPNYNTTQSATFRQIRHILFYQFQAIYNHNSEHREREKGLFLTHLPPIWSFMVHITPHHISHWIWGLPHQTTPLKCPIFYCAQLFQLHPLFLSGLRSSFWAASVQKSNPLQLLVKKSHKNMVADH